ncbi:MAG: transglycosylase SLT domain-containing protein [Spirochaetota bacterium]|nr:transglycosylase SLT domain-containing protein [Spirochaetota bacterium]
MKSSFSIIYPAIILISLLGFNDNSFSWSLIDIFDNRSVRDNKIEKNSETSTRTDYTFFIPPLSNKTLFEAINDLSICRRDDVRKFIYQYMTKGRRFLIGAIRRSILYHDIIAKIFNNNKNIPKDISLLPLLESGFNPYAVSRSNAVGLWQFLRMTSTLLGLKTDIWVDERRDIEKSTIAAIRHLKNLYKNFKSWELALAAYNGGAGHVKRAMQRSRAGDLWELIKSGVLKKETEEYVPRMAALLVIYKNQQLFNIKDEIFPSSIAETENIVLKYPVNINDVLRLSGVPISTIKRYNPELKRNRTPPYYLNYSIRLPVDAKERLKSNRKKLYKFKFSRVKRHTVKKGECIIKIARRYKTKAKMIIILNDIKKPSLIRPGQRLYIPI